MSGRWERTSGMLGKWLDMSVRLVTSARSGRWDLTKASIDCGEDATPIILVDFGPDALQRAVVTVAPLPSYARQSGRVRTLRSSRYENQEAQGSNGSDGRSHGPLGHGMLHRHHHQCRCPLTGQRWTRSSAV